MSHISFSEFKNWITCPFYHKLVHVDKIKSFRGNEYTAFGTAIHEVCERSVLSKKDVLDPVKIFVEKFNEEIESLKNEMTISEETKNTMTSQAKTIIPSILPKLEEYFGEYEVVSTEEDLYLPINFFDKQKYNFKGFIDLVLKTSYGKYHVIDWKSCSWGWDRKKRSDKILSYQLTFYKYFFAQKHNIDPKKIETHFALLKRTAKSNNVEIFRVTSGNKKTNNALNLLTKALYNISNKNYIKNRTSCHNSWGPCEFYKTKYCK